MIRKIVGAKVPSLREKSKPIKRVDKRIVNIIKDMQETLAAQVDPVGVGLAAPQIGKNLAIFVINYKGLKRVIINPKIISKSKKKTLSTDKNENKILEGCLSIPHIYGPLQRSQKVTISYLDKNGNAKEETFSGFGAQIVLHEIDHLNGILFVDKILESKGKLYKHSKGDSWEEVELP